MKTKTLIILLSMLLTANIYAEDNCCRIDSTAPTQTTTMTHSEATEIALPSIQCGMCTSAIESGIGELNGIQSVSLDLNNKTMALQYDPAAVSLEDIENKISQLGYWANGKAPDKEAYASLDGCCQMSPDELRALEKSAGSEGKWKLLRFLDRGK